MRRRSRPGPASRYAAQSPGMMIGSRILQGLMGAIMFPQILSVIQVTFPPFAAIAQARAIAEAKAAYAKGLEVATATGDLQTRKEIEVFLRRLEWA